MLDLSGRTETLGAYEAKLSWDASVLELVEVLDGGTPAFAGPLTRRAPGELVFSQFSVQGAGERVSLLRVRFAAVGAPGANGRLQLSFSVLDAAATFISFLPELQVQPLEVRIAGGQDSPRVLARVAVSTTRTSAGAQLQAEVLLDLTNTPERLGAYEARLTWDPLVLQLTDVGDGGSVAFAGPQTRRAPGELAFSQFSVNGDSGVLSPLRVRFTVVSPQPGDTRLGLSFAILDAAGTFADLRPFLEIQEDAVISSVAPTTWGHLKRGR